VALDVRRPIVGHLARKKVKAVTAFKAVTAGELLGPAGGCVDPHFGGGSR